MGSGLSANRLFRIVKSCVPKMEEQSESDREEFGAVPIEHRANQELLKNVFMLSAILFLFLPFFSLICFLCVSVHWIMIVL